MLESAVRLDIGDMGITAALAEAVGCIVAGPGVPSEGADLGGPHAVLSSSGELESPMPLRGSFLRQ